MSDQVSASAGNLHLFGNPEAVPPASATCTEVRARLASENWADWLQAGQFHRISAHWFQLVSPMESRPILDNNPIHLQSAGSRHRHPTQTRDGIPCPMVDRMPEARHHHRLQT